MSKLTVLFCFLLVTVQWAVAQDNYVFNQSIELDPEIVHEVGRAVACNDLGEIYFVGKSSNRTDGTLDSLVLLKLDAKGNYQRRQLFDINPFANKFPKELLLLQDGGLLIAGTLQYFEDPDVNPFILRLDQNWETVWYFEYDDPNDWHQIDKCIVTLDGGFLCSDRTDSNSPDFSNAWIVKVNVNGELEWDYKFESDGFDFVIDVFTDDSIGYYVGVADWTVEPLEASVLVYHFDADGSIVNLIGPFLGDDSYLLGGFELTETGEMVLAGAVPESSNSLSERNGYVAKINFEGELVWELIIENGFEGPEIFQEVVELENGDFAVAGYTRDNVDPENVNTIRGWLARVSSEGELIWQRVLMHDEDNVQEYLQDLVASPNGGMITVGETRQLPDSSNLLRNNMWIVKVDENGNDWLPLEVNLAANETSVCLGDTVFFESCAFNGKLCPYSNATNCTLNEWWDHKNSIDFVDTTNPMFIPETAGTFEFTYTVVDENLDTASASVLIDVAPITIVKSLTESDSLFLGQALWVSPVIEGPVISQHSWTGSGSEFLASDNEEAFFIPLEIGAFELTINFSNGFGCQGLFSQTINVLEKETGISHTVSQKLLIYPNPVEDVLFLSGVRSNKDLIVNIYGIHGEEVVQLEAGQIDVSHLPTGIYLIELKNNTGLKEYARFVKN